MLSEDLRWAQSVLQDPVEASIQATGMDPEDIKELRDAFEPATSTLRKAR